VLTEEFRWPEGKRAAISIAYERCPEQALRRLPVLTQRRLGATVFVQPTDLLEDPLQWRERLGTWHELGNATLHPLTQDGTLPNWTLQMVSDDLDMADDLLLDFAPEGDTVFALPGVETACSGGSYLHMLADRYGWIKSCHPGVNHPIFSNPRSLSQLPVVADTIGETLDSLEDGVERGAWCILSFDLRSDVVRRFHDAFLEVVPNSLSNVLWSPISQVGRLVSGFRSQLTLR
jgi:hypothetical protein